MVYLITAHEVKDQAAWKAAFDTEAGAAFRKSFGMRSYQILHAADDPNCLVVILAFDDAEAARKFSKSLELKFAMKQSGGVKILDAIDTSRAYVEIEKGTV